MAPRFKPWGELVESQLRGRRRRPAAVVLVADAGDIELADLAARRLRSILDMPQLADRQAILLTHEPEWFWELRQRLPGSDWQFKALRPYKDPKQGIAWDDVPKGFEEARRYPAHGDSSTAVAKARGAMDHHACIIAERLQLRLPFVRGPSIDRRHATKLLQRIAAEPERNFRGRPTAPTRHP